MRRTLDEWMVAALIFFLGLIFVADYSLGWPASRTWPSVLILWGAFRAASGLANPYRGGARIAIHPNATAFPLPV